MSDPRTTKAEREQNQVRIFLASCGTAYMSLEPGSDPPDVLVHREEKSPLAIEVTEYHPEPEHDRVGVERRWHQLKEMLDSLIKERPLLKGISIAPIFRDARMPRSRYHRAISEELVRCAEYALVQGWLGSERRKLSFSECAAPGSCRQISHDWLFLPAQEWPVLAQHVNVLYVERFLWDGYLPSSSFQAQAAWCSPYAAALRALLEGKEEGVRGAIQQGRYSKGKEPLWLLIVSNARNDLSSFAFGSEHLKQAIDECGFDFECSLFDCVWLMDESGGGRTQCLHPWNEQIRRAPKAVGGPEPE